VPYEEMDFYTGKAEVDRDERENVPPEPKNIWESMCHRIRTLSARAITNCGYRNLVLDRMRQKLE
jgi:hypothetical protein